MNLLSHWIDTPRMCRLAPDEDELLWTMLLLARRQGGGKVQPEGPLKTAGVEQDGRGFVSADEAMLHSASLRFSSVKPGGTSLLGMTQRAALVMEIVLCITQRGRAIRGWEG